MQNVAKKMQNVAKKMQNVAEHQRKTWQNNWQSCGF